MKISSVMDTRYEKSVTLCWKHFDVKKSQFISVLTSRGGRNRQLTLHNEANYNDIKTAMTDLFFLDGNSTFGLLKHISYMYTYIYLYIYIYINE